MKRLRTAGLVCLLMAMAGLAAAAGGAAAASPDLEEQVRQIAAELRCPVCQNLSVADSPVTLAQEMRAIIREQLEQGKTREEVRAYFVSKYGEWVLLSPEPSGFNLLIYVVPFLGGAAGVVGALVGMRRWVRRRRDRPATVHGVSAAERERLRRDLAAAAGEEEEDPGGPTSEAEGPLAELEAQRAHLYAAIRELDFDHAAGMISDADHAAAREAYEAEAVGILRRLDGVTASPPAAAAPAPPAAGRPRGPSPKGEPAKPVSPAPGPHRSLWLAVGAVALLAFGGMAGALLTVSIQPRSEGGSITGSPLTGTAPERPPMGAAPGEPGPAQGSRRPLDPATLTRMLQAAHAALDAGRLAEASAAYRAVLDRDPRNVEALTHVGNILERSGESDAALHVYDKALAVDPRYLHALWDKGRLLFQRADYAGALTAWQAFFDAAPPGPDRDNVEQRMADARARLAASGPVPQPPPKGAGAGQAAQPPGGR